MKQNSLNDAYLISELHAFGQVDISIDHLVWEPMDARWINDGDAMQLPRNWVLC